MNRIPVGLALGLSLVWGCGGPSIPDKPQLIVDRDSLGFGQEFGSATFIGTAPQDSIQLQNGGLQDLVIASTTYSGEPVFTIDGPLKTTLKGKETTFIRVIFAPVAEKVYSGSITITSNAQNYPTKTIGLSGSGLACQKLTSATDAGCRVDYVCSDGGNPTVACSTHTDGGASCDCLFNGTTTPLNSPTLCSLDRAAQIAATRNVCGWSL